MELAQIIERKQSFEIEKEEIGKKLKDQRGEAQKKYSGLLKKHNLIFSCYLIEKSFKIFQIRTKSAT